MRHRLLVSIRILAVALAVLFPALVPVAGQTTRAAAKAWTPPRTADGQPDLQGLWTMSTFTPLERPAHLAGKELYTEEEAAELRQLLTAEGVDPLARSAINEEDEEKRRKKLVQSQESVHYDNSIWLRTKQPKGLSSRRTSLIVDPPDGKIPPLTPEAKKRAAERKAARGFDSYENRPLAERCIAWRHEGSPMMPASYNDILQIFQAPGYVAILQEMSNNGPRIIPMDGRPHISPNIRQYPGDSRGRWEGDTLVVDTTNFTGKTNFGGSGEALHVVERFTRTGAETIRYEFTVEDPASWTQPWSVEIPMTTTEGPLYEYACHEGNYDVAHILEAARALEDQAKAKATAVAGSAR